MKRLSLCAAVLLCSIGALKAQERSFKDSIRHNSGHEINHQKYPGTKGGVMDDKRPDTEYRTSPSDSALRQKPAQQTVVPNDEKLRPKRYNRPDKDRKYTYPEKKPQ